MDIRKYFIVHKNERNKQCANERENQEHIEIEKAHMEREKLLIKPTKKTKSIGIRQRKTTLNHAVVVTMSMNHHPIMNEDVITRNNLLSVIDGLCFWCNKHEKQCSDHLYPCINNQQSEYSQTNDLNLFPSCNKCNNKKGNKSLEEWLPMLCEDDGWTVERKEILLTWRNENKHKLLIDTKYHETLKLQFKFIDKICDFLHKCTQDNDFLSISNVLQLLNSKP